MTKNSNDGIIRTVNIISFSIVIIMVFFLLYLIYSHYYFGKSFYIDKVTKKGIVNYEELIQYNLNKNIFHYLSVFSPIILVVFSGIFGMFTYITRQNISKSEEIIQSLNSTTTVFDNKLNVLKQVHSEYKELLSNSNFTQQSLYNNLLILFYSFLDDESKISAMETSRLIELMDKTTAIKSLLYLREQGSNKTIKFMKQLIPIYESSDETKYISKQIIETISEIEKRTKPISY